MAWANRDGHGLPRFAEQEFRDFLTCAVAGKDAQFTWWNGRRPRALKCRLCRSMQVCQSAPLSAQSPQPATFATWLYDLVQFDVPDVRSTRLGGINNQNDVVGSTFDGVRIRPFLVSGGVLSFPELPHGAYPEDINDLGQIVGEFYGMVFRGLVMGRTDSCTRPEHGNSRRPCPLLSSQTAMRWGSTTTATLSGPLKGTASLLAVKSSPISPTSPTRAVPTEIGAYAGINDAGDILGAGDTPISVPAAVGTIGNDINNVNTIVGAYWGSNESYPTTHGFVLSNGRYVSIDVPGRARRASKASTTRV